MARDSTNSGMIGSDKMSILMKEEVKGMNGSAMVHRKEISPVYLWKRYHGCL